MAILSFISTTIMIIVLLFDIRSDKVSDFRSSFRFLNLSEERIFKLLQKYTYNQMLFSFKSLEFEKWFTEEELKED